ncbi:MAG: 7-cyano-7-deazaguanine reductase [Bdellovibrio sp. CG12_big_fil_rev_8_21_14_0_65_39_13]|nr:MAG: 7-cyano-7-deazaguanine reductase [Bdellovibrio sp. CG22_combo_CG10-13_8_21_14_all_39_27]PIQ61302.1 MAG: 7-cyano-7-deazaguanine reductase [Bdellovibrio sp. CG12_big_fil_rev_8_21_14_0_65_39_13]PIR33611.1 MAG: 7-cyano-7-deazaguanine reductase [Bdellovibrio sp. CG11_big_fil_rev_8_21_14_0_20_39_38]
MKSKSHARDPKTLKKMKLGEKNTVYKDTYAPEVLESFANKNPQSEAWTTFICTEFTSLCPKTGQPDFAKIFVNYIADKKMVESKSMKLYLFSFRNHGDFHEDCIQTICDDLVKLLKPKYLEVLGEFTPRGGISIYPYSSYANSDKRFQELKKSRIMNYAPGKYSMPLERIY